MRRFADRLPEMTLVLAMVIFLVIGVFYTDRIPAWHEEISVHPSTGYRILRPEGLETEALPLAPWCGDPDPPRFVLSPSRPMLSLCARGLTLPVMVTPYFTGIFYWPGALLSWWHHGDVFLLRKLSLFVGLASLIQTYRLSARVADRGTAALGALLSSVNSAFVFAHSLLLSYEATPWLFVATALLVLPAGLTAQAAPPVPVNGEGSAPSPPRLSTLRLACGAALLGLSVLANVKAIFLMLPIAVIAWRAGIRWRLIRPSQWTAMLVAGAIPLLPMLLFAAIDPHSGFRGQVENRLSTLVRHLHPVRVAQEVHNLLIHASDLGAFADLAAGAAPRYNYWGWILPALALGFCSVALVRFMKQPRGPALAAACGALLVFYLVVSALLYDQYPAANYEPLHAVFGVAMAVTARGLGETIGGFLRMRAAPIGVAIAVTAAVPIAYNSVRLPAGAAELPLPVNAIAVRDLSQYLMNHSAPGESLWTVTYNYAGLFDSLGRGQLAPVQAHHLLFGGDTRQGGAAVEDEMTARWRRILSDPRRLPLRVVVPGVSSRVEEPGVVHLAPALRRAAGELNHAVELEATFRNRAGLPVIALYRVLAGPSDPGL